MADTLALLGGTPALSAPLQPYRSIGEAEAQAVAEVVRGGCLSGFMGAITGVSLQLGTSCMVEGIKGKLIPPVGMIFGDGVRLSL